MRLLALVLLAACVPDEPKDDVEPPWEETGYPDDPDGDGYRADQDCAPEDADRFPGAPEGCNGLDDDCDGTIDEGVTTVYNADADGDGFGDAATTLHACEAPAGYVADATDCDDAAPATFPGAPEACDGVDNDCDGAAEPRVTSYADADGDGFGDAAAPVLDCGVPDGAVVNASDCDDSTATAFPGNVEVCDEVDNNCDGAVDEGVTTVYYVDDDGDGWGTDALPQAACAVPTGYSERLGDCDDTAASVAPDAIEACNTLDDDCDGTADEADAADAATWYADTDGDGYGATATAVTACEAPAGHVATPDDCDDADAGAYPANTETCDGADDDCDGTVDEADAADASTWYADADGDGYGDAATSATACEAPAGYVADATDCDDADADVNPDTVWHLDYDGDGHGGGRVTLVSCTRPSGYVATATDCDDDDGATSPSATEVCDEEDNDCDDAVDEDDAADAATWYADADADGYGDPAVSTAACSAPDDHVADATDCDDTDAAVSPGAPEVCGGGDEDCDGAVDEDEVYGDAAACAAVSCDDLLATRPDAADGRYWIDPNGLGAYEVTCDMTTDGGGWTLVVSADSAEVDAADPPDFDWGEAVWTGAGYGAAGDATHISAAWADTPPFTELLWYEDAASWQESTTLTGDLADATKTTGTIAINASFSSSYGPYGGRLYRTLVSAICNTGNASTSWGAGLGAVRSCEHTYGTLYYEFAGAGFSSVELWIR